MPRFPERLEIGRAHPLGARFDGGGVNFALFFAHAERVVLCLFDWQGRREGARLDLPECTDGVWHGYLPGVLPGRPYGYRAVLDTGHPEAPMREPASGIEVADHDMVILAGRSARA